ncbi:hypothetical protein EIN_377190 [Entamoeba invadens IP1]|uniref:2-phosphosulfolactate phosphatase n=1 Tax=Entamoeba invadens IP1 TaxID=370355 RepID=A0A0A1TU91_ENTIV|nr:hypothetical protein EIN_377190 [Entamoeba invadens IP1]ELP83494.1 hypothetical protein EIN_377190 [Entamoeba invadens IP1]|eukprot:XP_004182840.1 hypothetical protein EIN_377190 [Entamoeba invadens IP1]
MEPTTSVIISPKQHQNAKGVCIVIDVLRASSVEAHLFLCEAKTIIPQASIESTLEMKKKDPTVVLIGERGGKKYEGFDFGNSPTELLNNKDLIKGKVCVHNTQQGTQSLVACINNPNVTDVFMCSPNNCQATIDYVKKMKPSHVTFVASGDEIACREDLLFGMYLEALFLDKKPPQTYKEMIDDVKNASGSKFFKNVSYFPEVDFYECYKLDLVDVVMKFVDGEIKCVH